jgi:rubrerythrin
MVALEAEKAGLAYYQSILDSTQDPEIRALAREFVNEESMHVSELQRWISACSDEIREPEHPGRES